MQVEASFLKFLEDESHMHILGALPNVALAESLWVVKQALSKSMSCICCFPHVFFGKGKLSTELQ